MLANMKIVAFFALAALAIAAPPAYKVSSRVRIGGAGRWDYAFQNFSLRAVGNV